MQLNNIKIKEDLYKKFANKTKFTDILLYFVIVLLFIYLISMSVVQEIQILDTLAGILCKIALITFSLILLEGATLSIIDFLRKDEVLVENYWKVIEANLTNKKTVRKKYIFEFLGGYEIEIDKNTYEDGKIGNRFYLVVVEKPGYKIVKHGKEVLLIYKKSLFDGYNNEKVVQPYVLQKNRLTNKKLKQDLFMFNLPEIVEVILSSLAVSSISGTIYQVIKQQYLTYLNNMTTFVLLLVIFVLFLIIFNKIQRYDKEIRLKNSKLLIENDFFVLVVKKKDIYNLVKVYPKYKYDNFNTIIQEEKHST